MEAPIDTRPTATPSMPSYARRNPFARVRAQYEKNLERSNTAPTLQTLPASTWSKHDRVEIQRNPPTQSRNPLYTSNEPVSPPTPPPETGQDADDMAPKGSPTKNGIELRSDDIRAATSKSRSTYSPNLPRPTMVSDKPGRPIVSFQRDYKPREIVMEQHHSSPISSPDALPDILKVGASSSSPQRMPSEARRAPFSRGSLDGTSTSPRPLPESPSKSRNLPEIPKWTPSMPAIKNASKSPIPTIYAPNHSSTPSIVLPGEPHTSPPKSTSAIPAINVETPSININEFTSNSPASSPTRTRLPQRPLPTPSPGGRPLPTHANTTPLPSKSTPHYSPSIRQSGTLCAYCALPIAGRILSAGGERFHPGCFVCHECHTNLECVAFYPAPEKQRIARLERIAARQRGIHVPPPAGDMSAEDFELADGDDTPRFYCHLDFHELFSPRCKSCKTPIEGEVIVACGAEWHAGHFFCAQCGDPFDAKTPFVEKDGYAWCVGCHTNRYSSKCRKCRKPVTDVVVKALGSDWHSDCFTCMECNQGFEDGRYFLRGDSQDPVCVKCEERRLKA